MKKKVITKKSLAELAKVMPLLDECEMRAMVGGVQFIVSGNSTPIMVGTSQDLRFIDTMREVNDLLATGLSKDELEKRALNMGSTWASTDLESRCDFLIGQIGRDFPKLAQFLAEGGGIRDSSNTIAGIDFIGKKLVISTSSYMSTYANIMSVLAHKEGHLGNSGISGGTGLMLLDERAALYATEASPFFHQISSPLRVIHLRAKIEEHKFVPSRENVKNSFRVSEEEADQIINAAKNGG